MDLDKFRMGYFLLWIGGKDWVSRKIKAHQKQMGLSKQACRYTHIDICGGGQWAVRAVPPRIKMVDIREAYKGREYALCRYIHNEYETRLRYKVAFWAATNVNMPYDILGLLRFKLPFLFHSKKFFFCSENALWSLRKEVTEAFGSLENHNCVPGHFFDSSEIEVIERGVM